jgi:MFS family permease
MLGLTQNYVTPYALAMKASTTQIGFLAGIPALAMVGTQFVSPVLVERTGSRKSFIVWSSLLHALMWLPVLLIPYFFPNYQVWWLIAFITMCVAFDSLGNAPWNSMMADLVPGVVRGRYFALRNRIGSFVTFILSFVAGGILQALTGNIFLGFTIIFAGAMVSRFFSSYFLSQMVEPPMLVVKSKQPSILKLSLTLSSTNIGKFIIFNALMNFAISFSSPFFSVYMLRDLKFNYVTYVIINATAALATLLFMPMWGRRIDKAGAVQVLKATSLFVPVVPIMWLFSANVYYLCLTQVIGGFAWGGFAVAVNIFLYFATTSENRMRYFAVSNALMFGGAAIGSLLGGIVAPVVPAIMKNSLLTIFLISGLARIIIVFVFIPRISEVRQVPKISINEILIGGINLANMKDFFSQVFRRFNQPGKK